jgi:hypothetical protein
MHLQLLYVLVWHFCGDFLGVHLLLPHLAQDLVHHADDICGACFYEGLHATAPGANSHVRKSVLSPQEKGREF